MTRRDRIEVLHLTAHLGGGVGKALSGLVLKTPPESNVRHTIVCLERPEKSHFMNKVEAVDGRVIICPGHDQLSGLIESADIVQLEWWNHPATIRSLCSGQLPAMRLFLWCHISGLHNPVIPGGLITAALKCIFTSPCSYEAAGVSGLLPEFRARMDVVYSSGGFDGLVRPGRRTEDALAAGYLGTLNFAKLHPHYVDFLASVPLDNFRVRMIGDVVNREILDRQCDRAGRTGMLEFRGYQADIAVELSSINTLVYLLNPRHYGTTENALLEAMAMEVVPVVLNNPAERYLVENHETGVVVNSPEEFAEAVAWLGSHPADRRRIGRQAAESVRNKFTAEKMAAPLAAHYEAMLSAQKHETSFIEIFGPDPADWFLSCQGNTSVFTEPGFEEHFRDDFSKYGLFEQTKGTVFHFLKYFPDNMRLRQWAEKLERNRPAGA